MAQAEVTVTVNAKPIKDALRDVRDDLLGAMRLIQRARDTRNAVKRDDFLVRALGTLDRRQARLKVACDD